MARLWTLGFEEGDLSSFPFTNTALLTSTKQRTGQQGLMAWDSGTLTIPLASNPTEIYFGGAFNLGGYHDSRDQIRFHVGGNATTLRCLSNGVLQVLNPTQSSAAGVISLNVWHYLEVWHKPRNSNGRFVAKIDGTTIFDITADTTPGNEYNTAVVLMGSSGGSFVTTWDDIVINDAAGSDNNTYPGQVRLLPIYPRAAGDSTQWGRAGVDMGSNLAHARMQGTYEDFTVLETDTTDHLDQYLMDVPDLPSDATITNVIAQALGRLDSGSGNIRVGIEADGTLSETADQPLSAAWKVYQHCLSQNPGTAAAWTESDLADLQMGIRAR